MSAPRRPALETTGRAELEQIERNTQRMFDNIDATSIPYTPETASDWVAPLPRTVAQALDRLAAAGGVTPVP